VSAQPSLIQPGNDCWRRIGVQGDRSCPELAQYVHCRNCPVFEDAARAFFERQAPEGYLDEWARRLAEPVPRTEVSEISVLIFRLRDEWLALETNVLVEVALPKPIHKIPHRSNEVLLGLVNVRGQLLLCVSLPGLLDIEPSAEAIRSGLGATSRLVVVQDRADRWAFHAEEVAGVHRLPRAQLHAVPSTLANTAVSFSQAVFSWNDRSVGSLDAQRVFSALRRAAQ
jgi:chemotaxis-related protein WspD